MPVKIILVTCVLVLLQLFFFNAIQLYDVAFAFIFPLGLMLFPLNWNFKIQMAIAFLIGLTVDISLLKIGLHSFSSVLILVVRAYWIDIITPQINPSDKASFSPIDQSSQWSFSYITPLIFLYSSVYHILNDLQFSLMTFWKIFATFLYSAVLMIFIFILFIKKSERR